MPRAWPTNSRWSPRYWPHHSSEFNIEDVKVMLSDTAMPCGKTSDRGDGGFKQFQFRVYRNIFIQEYPFVWMESTCGSLQMICNVRSNIPRAKCWKHATQPFVCSKTVLYNNGVSSWRRDVVWWLCLGCQDGFSWKRLILSLSCPVL